MNLSDFVFSNLINKCIICAELSAHVFKTKVLVADKNPAAACCRLVSLSKTLPPQSTCVLEQNHYELAHAIYREFFQEQKLKIPLEFLFFLVLILLLKT